MMTESARAPKSLLNLPFLLVIISVFFFFFNFHSFLLLPLRIKELGGTESDIGFITGIMWLSTLFSTPAVGVLVDRVGRRWFLAIGGLVMALTTLPFAYMTELYPFFPLLRVAHGAAFSLCFVSAGVLTADLTPASKRSQALGIFGAFTIVNYALAPFVGNMLIQAVGFEGFFLFVFAFGLLSFIIAAFVNEPRLSKFGGTEGTILGTLGRRGVGIAAAALLISGSGFIPALNFLPVYSVDIGLDRFDVFFISYTCAVLAVRVFGGWIPDRFGKKRAAVPSMLLFALSIIGLGLVTRTIEFIPLGVLFGISHGLAYPSVYALVIDLAEEGERGKAFSICSMSFSMGGMFGSFAYGYVAEYWGYMLMYILAGMVCLFGFALFGLFGRERADFNAALGN